MNCQFCYTGRMGLLGNLSTAQIVEQVVEARRFLAQEGGCGACRRWMQSWNSCTLPCSACDSARIPAGSGSRFTWE